MTSHPKACRCSLHRHLENERDACYQRLAQAILGPNAPREPGALARALAEHARTLKAAKSRRARQTDQPRAA